MSAPADLSAPATGTRAPAAETGVPAAPRRGRLFVKYVVSLVGLVAVVLIGNGALDVWFSYKEAKQTLVRIQQEKAESAAQRIAEFVDEIQRQIGWTTHAQWSAGSVDQRRFDYVRLLRQVPAITELAQLDSDGREQLKVSRLAMDVLGGGTDYSQDPKFTQAVAHKVWFSPVYFRKESEPYMTIAIAHAGRKPGVTVADVNLKLIWDVVSAIKVGEAGYAYVVGPDGRLIAHPDISLVLRNTDLSGLPQVAAALADPAARDPAAGVTIAPNHAGLSVLTAHAAIPALNWLVFVELPASEALAPLYDLLTRSGILLGLGLLLAALAGGVLARRMVVPIGRLQEGAERLGAGELDHRIELKTGDEIEALADRFNRMGAQLKESYATLEAKVEARTHELAEALEQQTGTAEVLKVISASPGDLEPVFATMLENATRICRAEIGRLTLFDGEAFITAAVRGAPPEYARFLEGDRNPLGSATALSRMAAERKPAHKPDLLSDPAYLAREPFAVAAVELGGARSLIAVPLLREQSLIGGLTLFRQRVEAFTDKEIALVTTFADQAVIAIENARLINETREALERQTATSDVLRIVATAPDDLQPIFEAMLEKATELCEAKFGLLWLYDGSAFTLVATRNIPPALATAYGTSPRQMGPNTSLARAVRTKELCHIVDLRDDIAYAERDPARIALIEFGGAGAQIAVPLLKKGEVIGVIAIYRQEPRAFAANQMTLVTTFADQAVIAMENARLIAETREALEQQTATADVLKLISRSTFDLQRVLDTLTESAVRLCGADAGNIWRIEGDFFRWAGTYGYSEETRKIVEQWHPDPGRGSLVGRTVQEGRVVQIADILADPEYTWSEAGKIGGIRTMLGVPLMREGIPVGVFALHRSEVRAFTEKQIALVATFADQAVIAIENARLINETREALEQQTATAEVLQVINASPGDLAPVFEAMLEKAMRLCEAAFGTLLTYDGERLGPEATRDVPAAFADFMERNPPTYGPGTAPARILAGERVVHEVDVMASAAYRSGDPGRRALVELGGARSLIAVPLLKGESIRGMFVIYRQEVRPFSDKQIALLQNFAAQAVIAMENARLITETREALEQQTATAEVLQVINSSPGDLAPVFDAILQKAHNLCGVAYGSLHLYDGERLRAVAAHGIPEAFEDRLRQGFVPGPNHPSRPVLAGAPFAHVPDCAEIDDPVTRAAHEVGGIRTALFIPLRKDEMLLGQIVAARREVRLFTEKEIALLQNFADQAVIAIENARLLGELRSRNADLAEALEYQTATSEVLRIVASSPDDLQPVFDAMLEKAMALCEARYGFLALYDGEAYTMAASANVPKALDDALRAGPHRPGPHAALRRLAQTKAPVHIEDARSDIAYLERDPWRVAAVEEGGARAQLVVPLLKKGELIGAFIIYRHEPRRFADNQIALVTNFADQAVIAIENARLLGELRQRTGDLARSVEELTATAEVLRVISSSTGDLEPVLASIIETASRLCAAEAGWIFPRDGDVYRLGGAYGFSAEQRAGAAATPITPDRGSISGRAILERRPVQVLDVRTDPEHKRPGAIERGARTCLGVPLLREDEPIGVIAVQRTRVEAFTDKQIALVSTFADQAVIAIENARLLGELRSRNVDLAEALEFQTATSEVLRIVASSPDDLQPVFEAMLEKATALCEAKFGVLFLYDGTAFTAAALKNLPSAYAEYLRGRSFPAATNTNLRKLVETKAPVHVADMLDDSVYVDGEPLRIAAVELGGIRSLVMVPLLKKGELVGFFSIYRHDPGSFAENQIALVMTFADQAVIAIENARLLGELRQRTGDLARSVEELTATADVLRAISSSTGELEPVLDTVVATAARLCNAERSFIVRRYGDTYRAVTSYGWSPELYAAISAIPITVDRGSLTGRTVLERRPIQILDVRADADYRFAGGIERGSRTVLGVPLMREGEPLGVICLQRAHVEAFTERQIELVRTFADQAVIAIENARLLGELRSRNTDLAESLEQQTVTGEVLKVISRSTFDLTPVFETLAENAVKLCAAERAIIFRFDGKVLRPAAWHNASQQLIDYVEQHPIAPGRQTISARAALERRTVQVPDVQTDPEYSYALLDIDPIRTLLAVPMLKGDQLVGVITIYRLEVKPFTDKQIALVTIFADQAVIAIENARLLGELRDRSAELARSVDELTATSDVLKIISRSTVELKTVLDTLVDTAARLCHADQSLMFRRQGDHYQRVASRGISGEFEEWLSRNPLPVAGRGTITGRAVAEGRTIHVSDVLADPEYSWQEGQRIGGFRTLLAVPLVRGDALIGVFALSRTRVAPFTDKEIELVTTFADQAMIAIENSRLFEELRARSAELARSVEELTTLREVGQAVSSTLDLATVLETIVRRAVALAGAEAGAIYRYRKSDRQFRLGTAYGLGEELTARIRGAHIREEETMSLARAIQERAPAQIPDLLATPQLPLRDLMVAAGFRAALQVPLVGADRVFGVLSIQKKTVGEFPESTVKLMQTFASQSVLAIQNARLFREVEEQGRQLALASQHKSQFLANMSHELRTPLNAVLGYAELLADGIYGELGEKARGVLERIQSNGKHLLGLINDVLDLSKIEAGQLTLAIDDYAMAAVVHSVVSATESLAKAKGLSLVTSVPRVLPMGRGDERRLTQVLLNLVGNAIKFTEKGSVGIAVKLANNRFELAVKDTGPGIAEADQARIFEEFQQVDSSSTRKKGGTGLGLAISKRIVEMHGGAITVESKPGKGSTFLVVVPVRVDAAREVA